MENESISAYFDKLTAQQGSFKDIKTAVDSFTKDVEVLRRDFFATLGHLRTLQSQVTALSRQPQSPPLAGGSISFRILPGDQRIELNEAQNHRSSSIAANVGATAAQLSTHVKELERLGKTVDELVKKKDEVQSSLILKVTQAHLRNSDVAQFQNVVSRLQQQVAQEQKHSRDLSLKAKQLEESVQQLQLSQKESERVKKNHEMVLGEVNRLKDKAVSLTAMLKTADNRANTLKQANTGLKATLAIEEASVRRSADETAQLNKLYMEVKGENNGLLSRAKTYIGDLERMKQLKEQLEQTSAALEQKNQRLEAEVAQKLNKAMEGQSQLAQECETWKSRAKEQRIAIESLEAALNVVDSEKKEVIQRLNRSHEVSKEDDLTIGALQSCNLSFSYDKEEKIKSLNDARSELKRSKEVSEKELAKLSQELRKAITKQKAYVEDIEQLQNELRLLENEKQTEKNDQDERYVKMFAEVNALKSAKDDVQSTLKHTTGQLKGVKASNTELRISVGKLKEEKQYLMSEVKKLSNQSIIAFLSEKLRSFL